MLWGVMEHHQMNRITQKGSTAGHGGQNAAFAFNAQVFLDPTERSDEAYQCLRLMDIEIIADNMPAGGLLISGNDGLHMGQKIFLRPRRASVGSHNLSCHDIS